MHGPFAGVPVDEATRSDIERYLAGGMTDAEASSFLASLRGDREALAHLGRVLEQQAHLFDLLREQARASASRLAAATPPRRAAWRWAAAAAVAVVAVGAFLLARPRGRTGTRPPQAGREMTETVRGVPAPPAPDRSPDPAPDVAGTVPDMTPASPPASIPDPPARIESVEGPVYVVTDGGRILAHAGQSVLPGQGVRTEGPEGRVVLVLPGASRLESGPDSAVTLFAEGRGLSAFLSGGRLAGTIADPSSGPVLTLLTPHAEVRGAGARFVLECDPDETRLAVSEGLLRFRRTSGGEAIDVAAGRRAVAGEGAAFASRPADEDPPAVLPPAAAAEPAVPPAPPAPAIAVAPAAVTPTRAVSGRLVHVQGEVRVHDVPGVAPLPARAGQPLLSGQGLETVGEEAFAVVVCVDATRIELGANARAVFDAAGKRVVLDYGVLRADVSKQPRGASVALVTPHAEVKVLGTRFVLTAEPKATTVEVEEGHVRMSRRQDGVSTVVSPGFFASVHGRDPVLALPVRSWRSWETTMNPAGDPQAVVPDASGRRAARLEFYESSDNAGVAPGPRLPVFTPGRHVDFGNNDKFNHVEQYWAHAPKGYPYAGKSLVGRGEDAGERGAPPPLKVRDLQLHPPNNDHLVVAAFVVPVDGLYRVSGLGVRRVDERGGPVRYLVADPSRRKVAELTATPDRAWVWEPRSCVLGMLKAGDRIHFAVSRQGDYGWDAAEIAWMVTATDP
jgi:ferric-dicitrate binding protein FerR (iron transport regulator)